MAKKNSQQQSTTPVMQRIAWLILAGGWLFMATALASFSPTDSHRIQVAYDQVGSPITVGNWCGRIGAWLATEVYVMLGIGVWFIMAGILAYLVLSAARRTVDQLGLRLAGLILSGLAFSGLVALWLPDFSSMPEGSGGLVAIYISGQLVDRFSHFGASLVWLMAMIVGAILTADRFVLAIPPIVFSNLLKLSESGIPQLAGMLLWGRRMTVKAVNATHMARAGAAAAIAEAKARVQAEAENQIAEHSRTETAAPATDRPAATGTDEDHDPDPADTPPAARHAKKQPDNDADSTSNAKPLDPNALREKFKNLPINRAAPTKNAAPPQREPDFSGYQFPGMDLLEDAENDVSAEMEQMVRDQASVLEQAMQTYGIDAEVVGIDSGPTITMYEVQPAPGTKVSKLNAISSDLARAMKAQNIRIVPTIAGRTTIGVEVPNLKKETVRMKDLMIQGGENALKKMALPMFLGKDASGEPLILDLAKMPHCLIAGTTGSGKSVCMNTIIMSILYSRRPDEVKLVLVDPKMVEMSQFKALPHLMCPVVTDMNKAAAILEWAVTKMDERYELLAEVGKRDIDGYNELGWDAIKQIMEPANEIEEAKIPKKLYRMIFVIDELADLMMTNKEVESHIVRIAQKARAVGIHLILATQRPQANVVTGLIKSNMPCRISFKVASGMDSRIVLDHKGAELLLGQGDMLCFNPRNSELVRAQGTFLDELEIRRAVKFIKKVAEPSFENQLVQLKAPGNPDSDADGDTERDDLFDQAVRIILESQRGSVSLLQRRLTIGYTRASRLIEQIADAGILGPHKNAQAREVKMTLEEWEALHDDNLLQADPEETSTDESTDFDWDEPDEDL